MDNLEKLLLSLSPPDDLLSSLGEKYDRLCPPESEDDVFILENRPYDDTESIKLYIYHISLIQCTDLCLGNPPEGFPVGCKYC